MEYADLPADIRAEIDAALAGLDWRTSNATIDSLRALFVRTFKTGHKIAQDALVDQQKELTDAEG